ncbi:MAG: RpiB/LacA/LacB family sugar-phosphate isomerase [Candidatus Dadabacteria bacterium]|nr:RpiB/LacA/LacB family sugar-phosphate isomerase [Candidatus Dadabacteria bacterium]MCY4047233.1 RpiB/LacA/LacB family sugar-phosphate isomerase [Candidatus Dadabacteria bacterium]
MSIAVGSDESAHLTDFVLRYLERRGESVRLFGPLAGEKAGWTDVAEAVALEVSRGECDQGIIFCWTGTGVSIAANKIPGVRAALCADAKTAEGARKWNDANILAISLRATSTQVASEILDGWFSASPDDGERENINKVSLLEEKYFLKR